jgi:hypothetical protein
MNRQPIPAYTGYHQGHPGPLADKDKFPANWVVVEDSKELKITAQEARRGIDIYGEAVLPGMAGQSR